MVKSVETTMNNNIPNAADAPVPPAGTEQAAADPVEEQEKPEVSYLVLDVVGDVVEIVIAVFD